MSGKIINSLLFIYIFIITTPVDIHLGGSQISNAIPTALLLLIISLSIQGIEKGTFIKSRFIVYSVIFINVISVFLYFFNVNDVLEFSHFRDLFVFNMISLSLYLFYCNVMSRGIQNLVPIFKIILILNVLFVLLQVCIYYLNGKIIDFHSFFFPFSREVEELVSWGTFRAKGFQLEPGAYSIAIFTCALLLYCITNKMTPIIWVSISTVFLTYSFSGIISVIIFLGLVLISDKYFYKNGFVILIFAMAFFISPFIMEYIDVRYMSRSDISDTSSDGLKMLYLHKWLDFDGFRQIMGSGFRLDDTGIDSYIQSLGPIFNIVFYFGIAGCIFLIYSFSCARGLKAKIIFISFLSLKVNVFSPVFWFFVYMTCCKRANVSYIHR